MAKRLSEQLAELSVRAKNAEDAVAAARKEAHDKVVARREQAHAAATAATEKVNQEVKSVKDSATRNWSALQAKIAADIQTLKAGIAQRKREREVGRAEHNAERLEWEAGFAIDYAVASIEQAKLAVLDAIAGRVEAEEARKAGRNCSVNYCRTAAGLRRGSARSDQRRLPVRITWPVASSSRDPLGTIQATNRSLTKMLFCRGRST
jgi:hypothetical protein